MALARIVCGVFPAPLVDHAYAQHKPLDIFASTILDSYCGALFILLHNLGDFLVVVTQNHKQTYTPFLPP